jgi:hypothetical protein
MKATAVISRWSFFCIAWCISIFSPSIGHSQEKASKAKEQVHILTNKEYKKFVSYVYDSICKRVLYDGGIDEFGINEDKQGNPIYPPLINKKTKIDLHNTDQAEILRYRLYPKHETFNNQEEVDSRKLTYSYTSNDTVLKTAIYPDTLCWSTKSQPLYASSNTYSLFGTLADALTCCYFNAKEFDNLPVVGLNENQVKSYINWWNRENPKQEIRATLKPYGKPITVNNISIKHWYFTPESYRYFIKWVADSLVLSHLGNRYHSSNAGSITSTQPHGDESIPSILSDFVFIEDLYGNSIFPYRLNWSQRGLINQGDIFKYPKVVDWIKDIYNPKTKLWNKESLAYQFNLINFKIASEPTNKFDVTLLKYISTAIKSRNDFFISTSINLIPEELTINSNSKWINLDSLSFDLNQISWIQAYAYLQWISSHRKMESKSSSVSKYIFPSQEQWDEIRKTGKTQMPDNSIDLPTDVVFIEN